MSCWRRKSLSDLGESCQPIRIKRGTFSRRRLPADRRESLTRSCRISTSTRRLFALGSTASHRFPTWIQARLQQSSIATTSKLFPRVLVVSPRRLRGNRDGNERCLRQSGQRENPARETQDRSRSFSSNEAGQRSDREATPRQTSKTVQRG